jgi:hypothetical protein
MRGPAAAIAATVVASWIVGASAFAQPSPSSVAAEELFREGRALLEAKSYAAACEKLEASEKLEPSVGTLFSLGKCREGQGRLASAWFAYRAAATLAAQLVDARRAVALQQAEAIEPHVARIWLHLPASDAPSELRIDGERIAADAAAAPLLVDPGPHRIEATAGTSFATVVDIPDNGVSVDVTIPPLPPVASPTARTGGHWKRDVGLGSVALGSATIVVGAVLGMQAIVKGRDANGWCPTTTACPNSIAVHENDVAKTYADFSTVLIPVGVALAAAGAYLLITSRTTVGATVTPEGARLDVGARW